MYHRKCKRNLCFSTSSAIHPFPCPSFHLPWRAFRWGLNLPQRKLKWTPEVKGVPRAGSHQYKIIFFILHLLLFFMKSKDRHFNLIKNSIKKILLQFTTAKPNCKQQLVSWCFNNAWTNYNVQMEREVSSLMKSFFEFWPNPIHLFYGGQWHEIQHRFTTSLEG